MAAKIVEIAIMEGIAVLLFVFAYAIGVKQKLHLIAGYNEHSAETVHDKPGLARFIARVCLAVGLASALMPLGTYLWGATPTGFASVTGAYGGFIAGVVALTMLHAREYARSPLGHKATR
jgi:hypothetical protein